VEVVGCGYEVVKCGWVGGGGVFVWGGRRERSLFGESTVGAEKCYPVNLCPAKSAKKNYQKNRGNKNRNNVSTRNSEKHTFPQKKTCKTELQQSPEVMNRPRSDSPF